MKKTYSPWYYYYGNKLIKKPKPCLPGNYIHIHKWDGCYYVEEASARGFTIKKNRELVFLPWEEFRCLQGEGKSDMTMIKRELRRLGSSLTGNVFQINSLLKLLKK